MSLKLTLKVGIALFACFVSTGIGSAQVIGVDFNNGGATDQSPSTTDVVGPYASAGWYNNEDLTNPPTSYYNQFNPSDTGSPVTLLDSNGQPTTTQFGFNTAGFTTLNGGVTYSPSYGAQGSANATLTPDQQLYNGAATVAPSGYVQQVTLSNVSYSTYNVYVLVSALDGAVGYPYPTGGYGEVQGFTNVNLSANTGTAGSSYWFYSDTNDPIPSSGFSYTQATGTTQSTATVDANYVLFSGLTSADGTVSFDLSAPSADGNGGAAIMGLEIVDTSSSAVPEPSTYAMLLAGLGFVALKMRRKLVK